MLALAFAHEPWPSAPARPRLWLVPAAPGLSPSEQQAVEIGREDAYRLGWDASVAGTSLKRRLIAALSRLTGIEGVIPLADTRLEKLRLFASMMRRDDRRVHALGEHLLADGLSPKALHQAIGLALA